MRALAGADAPAEQPARRRIALSRRGERLARTPFPIGVLAAPRPFRPHTPAVDAFPVDLWGRLVARYARSVRPDRLRDGDARGFQALDRLNRMERAAFLLRDVEQLPLAETAAVLECPVGQVQAQVHRARVTLVHLLGDLANSLDLDFGFPARRTA